MSPEMKEDSDCFLTVSFHIRLMRLCVEKKAATDQDSTRCCCFFPRLLALRTECLCSFAIQTYACIQDSANSLSDDMFVLQSLTFATEPSATRNGCAENLTVCNLRDCHVQLFFSLNRKSRSSHQIPSGASKIDLTKSSEQILKEACTVQHFTAVEHKPCMSKIVTFQEISGNKEN